MDAIGNLVLRGIFTRQLQRVGTDIQRDEGGFFVCESKADRNAAGPRADVGDDGVVVSPQISAIQHLLDQAFGLRSWDECAFVNAQNMPHKLPFAQDVLDRFPCRGTFDAAAHRSQL